jgi:hypothetical protein
MIVWGSFDFGTMHMLRLTEEAGKHYITFQDEQVRGRLKTLMEADPEYGDLTWGASMYMGFDEPEHGKAPLVVNTGQQD